MLEPEEPALRGGLPWPLRLALGAASLVVIVAGLRAIAPLMSGFLFALLLTLVLNPLTTWLRKLGLPQALAIVLTLLIVLGGGAMVIVLVGNSVSELARNLPQYRDQVEGLRDQVLASLDGLGMNTEKLDLAAIDPKGLVGPATSIVGTVVGGLGHAFFVLLITAFMLIEFSSIFDRFETSRSPLEGDRTSLTRFGEMARDIQKYVGLSALLGAIGAFCFFVLLKAMGVPYVATWVVLFFVMSFVPTVGGIIAVIPALLLVLLEQGWQRAVVFAIIFVFFNSGIGDILKPRIMQRGFEISIVAVFMSLVFWNFVLGPVGIVLAVPLTITLRRLAQEYSPELRAALVE
jgi:predicted PurR-regulated permease PerM